MPDASPAINANIGKGQRNLNKIEGVQVGPIKDNVIWMWHLFI